MPGIAVQQLERVWTVQDREQLPDDDYRYECVDGQLVCLTPPRRQHQRLLSRLHLALEPHVPPTWEVLWDQAVRLGSDWRIPDLLVVPRGTGLETGIHDPTDVQLAIEVVSRSSRRTDRVLKAAEYADAGVAHYWRVEIGTAVELWTYVLAGRRYDEPVKHVRTAAGLQPFGVRLDLDALDPR